MVVNSSSSKNKYKDLSNAEKARLAGAIWIHGSIDIEHSRKRGYYYPRIMLSMPNPLPYDCACAFKRFGMKKGNITKAIKEAVILWLYSDARTEREARMPAWKCRTLSAQSYGEEKT